MMMRPRILAATLVVSASLLSACGGGSGQQPVTRPTSSFDGQMSTCRQSLLIYDSASRAHWEDVERVCTAAANDSSLDSISERANARFNAARAKIELAAMTEASGSAQEAYRIQEYYREANDILEGLLNDSPNFNQAKLEHARAQAGLSYYDRALVILSPLETLGGFGRIDADSMLSLRAKLTKARIMRDRAGQYEQVNDQEMLTALEAYNRAWSDTAPLAPGVSDPFAAQRQQMHTESRAELIEVAEGIADRGLDSPRYSALPPDQARAPAENARRALDIATTVVRSGINPAVTPTPKVEALARLSNQLGTAELVLAGFEGPARAAEFRCASGQGRPARLEAARSAFEVAQTHGSVETGSYSEAMAGIGCATQALAPTDPQSRSIRLSALERARSAFEAARNSETGDVRTQSVRHLQLGRVLKDLALLQRDMATTRPGGSDTLPANARATLDQAIRSFESAYIETSGISDPQTLRSIRLTNARTFLDKSEAYAVLGQQAEAHEALREAIAIDSGLALAHLELGKFYYRLSQTDPVAPATLAGVAGQPSARLAFNSFVNAQQIAANPAAANPELESEALYHMSRITTESPSQIPNADYDDAVTFAGLAYDRVNSFQNRAQECLARITRGNGGREAYLTGTNEEATAARSRCTGAMQSPESYLLSGQYQFRLSHFHGQRDQQQDLQLAIIAFEEGAQLYDSNRDPKSPAEQRTRARLEMAKGVAQGCAGQPIIGQRIIDALNAENPAGAAEAGQYLNTYKTLRCRAS